MGLFGFGKGKEVVDLAERYRRKKAAEEASSESNASEESGSNSNEITPFGFLDPGTNKESQESQTSSEGVVDLSSGGDRRKRLVKRISDMTGKLEDLTNQIYHLQQRIEVVERKMGVNKY